MPTKAELYAQMAEKVATQLTGSWQEWAVFPRLRGTETSGAREETAPPRRSEPLRSKVAIEQHSLGGRGALVYCNYQVFHFRYY